MKKLQKIRQHLSGLSPRGFVGPKYDGLLGKARLLIQGNWAHEEIIRYAEPFWWETCVEVPDNIRCKFFDEFEAAAPYINTLGGLYSRDFSAEWETYFGFGQLCAILTVDDTPAAFGWAQQGDLGAKCYYMQLKSTEYRIFRGGVAPTFRRRGLHSIRHKLMLEELFRRGATRVYVDAFADNIPSLKGQLKAGYKEFGRINVFCPLGKTEYVRWI